MAELLGSRLCNPGLVIVCKFLATFGTKNLPEPKSLRGFAFVSQMGLGYVVVGCQYHVADEMLFLIENDVCPVFV